MILGRVVFRSFIVLFRRRLKIGDITLLILIIRVIIKGWRSKSEEKTGAVDFFQTGRIFYVLVDFRICG